MGAGLTSAIVITRGLLLSSSNAARVQVRAGYKQDLRFLIGFGIAG